MARTSAVAQNVFVTDDDMPTNQQGDTTPEGLANDRGSPIIAEVDKSILNDGYAEEMAFMHEMVTIILAAANEQMPAQICDFCVNGKTWFISVDTEVTIPRYVLECIVRSVATDVRTTENRSPMAESMTTITRRNVTRHPVTVVKDTDKGTAWLRKLRNETR